MEPPRPALVVEDVVVTAHELDRPAGLPFSRKMTSLVALASSSFHSVTSVLTTRWRWVPRLPLRVCLAERVVALVGAQAGDLADAVGAEGGDDVVGPAVVERLGVGGEGGADALGDVCVRPATLVVRSRIAPLSESEVDDRPLERVQVDLVQRREQLS